jgi:hypothetical protein
MKITKTQLRRIIKEEKKALLQEFDLRQVDESMASTAADLGAQIAGRPDVAMQVRDALAQVYPASSKAFYNAFSRAQGALDQMAMDSDWD